MGWVIFTRFAHQNIFANTDKRRLLLESGLDVQPVGPTLLPAMSLHDQMEILELAIIWDGRRKRLDCFCL